MSREEILAAVNRAIESGIAAVDETQDPLDGYTYGAHIRSRTTVKSDSNEVVLDVMRILEKEPMFEWLFSSFYYPGPRGGGCGILPIKVANWLLAKSLALPGKTEEALSMLETFANANAVQGNRVIAIYGVDIRETININENARLLPIVDMWPSLGMDHLAEVLGGDILFHLPMGQDENEDRRAAIAFLAERFDMSPALRQEDDPPPAWFREHDKAFQRLSNLAHSIALMPDTIPQVIGRWVDTEPIDVIPGLTGGASGDLELMEIIPKRFNWLRPLSVHLAVDRLRAFSEISPKLQDTLSVPLQRLPLASARRNPEDSFLELGIALESLFSGDGNQSEIAHKVAIRGAMFVSERAEDRQENFQLLKAAYDLRSQAVHRGKISHTKPIGGVQKPVEEVLAQTITLCRTAINKIVDLGKIPDWNSIELAID